MSDSFFFELDDEAGNILNIPNHTGSPERRLLLAILERAILDFVGNEAKEQALAEEWIFDEESSELDRFSFAWICAELDLDEKKIAAKIRKMPRRGSNRVAPWYFAKAVNAGLSH